MDPVRDSGCYREKYKLQYLEIIINKSDGKW